jgi:TM2 domain-containing membrane protein YozV
MFCPQCGAPNDASAKFCFKCGAALSTVAPPVAAPPVADPRVRGAAVPAAAQPQVPTQTSPVLATILSLFIPGVGQLINSDMKKGVVMFVLAIVLFAPTVGVGTFAVAIWSAVDAYRVATGAAKRW